MLQIDLVDDDVLRIAQVGRLCGAEETEQRPFGSKDARQLGRDRLRRRLVEIVDQIPAQHAVNRAGRLRKSSFEEVRQPLEFPLANMPIEIGKNILDENLAPELLAEKTDVAADDRAQIEQHRRSIRGERGQE